MHLRLWSTPIALGACCSLLLAATAAAEERSESFDAQPNWVSINNRISAPEAREVRQDFGYSRTSHAGGQRGEIGGYIAAAAEPAYYARAIPAADFGSKLSASGRFVAGDGGFHILLGYFNSQTLGEWRTPNTIALRLNGRGEVYFSYVEYCTSRWRAGGDDPRGFATKTDAATGRQQLVGFPTGNSVHRWSLRYDPDAAAGRGAIFATMDEETAECQLAEGHRGDAARFDRFGLLNVMKSADSGGEVWLDDLTIGEVREDFTADPNWDQQHNRRTYRTRQVRPWFDFGFSPTQFAGGKAAGELGGIFFRGDCRYPEKMAAYADAIEPLTLDRPIRARGKVAMRRGVSDSAILIGFFNSQQSMAVSSAQDFGLPTGFLGISTDGPSRDGFYFMPVFRLPGDVRSGTSDRHSPPRIYPDGSVQNWSLEYAPAGEGGAIRLALGDQTIEVPVSAQARAANASFDRFGLLTTWIDGNSQSVYFDDLTYTCRQE